MTSRRKVVAAAVLWVVLAAVVWNVVSDRVIVLAGRQYVRDASALFQTSGNYLPVDDVMWRAVVRALRLASASAAGILLTGGALIWWAARRKVGAVDD